MSRVLTGTESEIRGRIMFLDLLFQKEKKRVQIRLTVSLGNKPDVTSHELSRCALKFTCFTQFYANIRALKPSIGTSPVSETRSQRERVSENMALAPDP